MGLKVWLPLNGNLDNKGASTVTVTNSGATVDNAGKIGQCYYFNGSSACMVTDYSTAVGSNDFSIAMWLKIPTLTSGTYFAICTSKTNAAAGAGFGIYWNYSQKKFLWSTADGSTATEIWMANTVDTIVYDKWIHLVMVRNNSDAKKGYFYINGTRYELSSVPAIRNITTDTKMNIGRCTNSSYYAKMYLNDFRIYDHALSVAEVNELAKGLVLHYKLDDSVGFTDLVTRGASYNIYNNHNNTNMPSTLVNTNTYYDGDTVFRETCTPTDNSLSSIRTSLFSHGVYNWNRTFKASTKYVFWIYYKPISHSDTVCGGTASNIGGWTEIPPVAVGGGWYRVGQYRDGSVTSDKTDNIFVSFRVPSATTGTAIVIDWASPHLLEGTSEIPSYDYTSTLVYDSSGNGYHGTINGALSIESSSPKNSTNIHIGATSQYIKCGAFYTSGFSNSYTFAWWGKCSSFSNTMHWGFSDGVRLNGLYNGNLWNTGDGSNNPLYNPGTTTQVTAPTTGAWHHYAMTGDGSTCKVYKDGVHWATAKTYKTITGTQIYINGWDAGTSYCHSNLSMSDFRVYSTALSAEDVYELYKTEAKAAKGNNIHTYSFRESEAETISNTGIVSGHNIIESPSVDSLKYDKTVYTEPDGSKWVRIFHHNDPTDYKFSNSVSWKDSVYIDANRWFDIYGNIELAPKYELMLKQKTTSSASEVKYRWIQTVSPLLAVYNDVKPASVTRITTSGYTDGTFGGLYILNSNTHMVIANNSNGNWYGAIGCWTAYNGGIPGYPTTTVTSGYMDLYLRIYPNIKIIKNTGFAAEHLIEM